MAIAEDASAPIAVHPSSATWGTTVTTASFTPAANSLLLVLLAMDGSSGSGATVTSCTVTDSASRTWSLLKRENVLSVGAAGGTAEVWCADAGASPAACTVSVQQTTGTSSGATGHGNVVVKVLTGAAARASQTGATAAVGGATSFNALSITTTTAGSVPYGALVDYTAAVAMTANANSTIVDSNNDAVNGDTWTTIKASSATGTPGAISIGVTNAAFKGQFALVEILAAAAGTNPALVFRPARVTRKLVRVARTQTRQPVLPQAAVNTNQPNKVNVNLRRAQFRVTRRGQENAPVPPQAAVNSNQPNKAWQGQLRRKFGLGRGGDGSEPPWSQQTPVVTVKAPERVGSARVTRGLFRVRRGLRDVPQTQTPAVTPNVPLGKVGSPDVVRSHLKVRRPQRDVPHPQPRTPPTPAQRPRKALSPPRGQAITPIGAQAAPVTAAARPIDRQGSRVQRALWTVRRRVVGIFANTTAPSFTDVEWTFGQVFTDWHTSAPRTEWAAGYPHTDWASGTLITNWTTGPATTGWTAGTPQTDT